MTDIPTREWLLSDAPQTRAQARLGAIYQGWLTFRANKLAMFGLIILVLLLLMAIMLAIPLLAKLSGNKASPLPERVRVRAATRLKKSPGRLDFQRGILARNADGELEVSTTGHQGSHIFSSFSQGNCFIVLERERGSVEAGEWVEVESFNHLFGG